ncbi:MAG TPA: hypothetical protein VHA70_07940 [Bauldia sp.]|nr:hypothetical protein [Bauldia sp.]
MSNVYDAGAVTTAPRSAVAWPAIFAGSVTGAAVSVILVLLGAGIGLASVSPWGGGVSPTTFGVGAAIWLVVIEWVAAGFAGFFAGRLRTRMTGYHNDEVFFRDTAHGFIAWSFSLVILAAVFASSLAGILGKATDAAATVASGAAQAAAPAGEYFTDRLFRSGPPSASTATATPPAAAATSTTAPAPAPTESTTATAPAAGTEAPAATTTEAPAATMTAPTAATAAPTAPAMPAPAMTGMNANAGQSADVRAEAGRILAQSIAAGQISADDRTYLASLVASSTGVPQADAEARVDAAVNDAKNAADTARSAAAKASLFLAISLLVGAFIACVAGALGGRERDEDEVRLSRVA